MATVSPQPPPHKFDARLDRELGKATGRIRLNDLLVGGLSLAMLALAYAVGDPPRPLAGTAGVGPAGGARRIRAGVRAGRLPCSCGRCGGRSTPGSPPGGSKRPSPTPRTRSSTGWTSRTTTCRRGAGRGRRKAVGGSPGPTSTRPPSRSGGLARRRGGSAGDAGRAVRGAQAGPVPSLVSRTFNPFTSDEDRHPDRVVHPASAATPP